MGKKVGKKKTIKKRKDVPQIVNAKLVLKYTREATDAFQAQCDASRQKRRAGGGATTHAEQDLLRARLVFAAAGLDSLLKHMIRDCLRDLAQRDQAVQAELETFVLRRLKGDSDSAEAAGRKFLAQALATPEPWDRITQEYVKDLTGDSLQSPEQLFRATKALGLSKEQLGLESKKLRNIFGPRNQMIHELDIRLDVKAVGERKRRSRTIPEMTERVDYVLEVAQKIVDGVEDKLSKPQRERL